jgi:hypothetical protein
VNGFGIFHIASKGAMCRSIAAEELPASTTAADDVDRFSLNLHHVSIGKILKGQ